MGTKISALTELTTGFDDADELPIVDDSVGATKKITQANLRSALITGGASTIATSDLTASRALSSNASGKVAVATTTLTELQGLNGLTASRAVATTAGGVLTASTATATELGYLSGVTSAIQTQFSESERRNLIGNGNFNIWDLGTTPSATDNAYFVPGWRYLSDATSTKSASQSTSSPPNGSRYLVSLDGTKVGNASVGAFFVIRAEDSIPLQGKTVTLSFYCLCNGTDRTAIFANILSWTGTADGTSASPISAWNGGNIPTFAAGYTAEATHALITTGGGTTFTVTAALDTSSINNVAVLIWGYGSLTTRARWSLAQVQLAVGATATNFVHRPIQEERNFLALHNYAATGAPGVGDDIADGYALGSNWIDVSADSHYICLDCTAGAAVWKKTTP